MRSETAEKLRLPNDYEGIPGGTLVPVNETDEITGTKIRAVAGKSAMDIVNATGKRTEKTKASHHAYHITRPIFEGLVNEKKEGKVLTDYFEALDESEKTPVAVEIILRAGVKTFFEAFPDYASGHWKTVLEELFKAKYHYQIAKNIRFFLKKSTDGRKLSAEISQRLCEDTNGKLGLGHFHENFPALSRAAMDSISYGGMTNRYGTLYEWNETGGYFARKQEKLQTPKVTAAER